MNLHRSFLIQGHVEGQNRPVQVGIQARTMQKFNREAKILKNGTEGFIDTHAQDRVSRKGKHRNLST